jgi:hypothetical protein
MTSAWIRATCTLVGLAAACVAALPLAAQKSRQPLTLEPLGVTGEAIFPAYEGWGPVKDGSIVLLMGYYNRNNKDSLDIPIGQNNRIEPGGPDYGQPTHFEPSREHGVFAIRVPKDFGSKKLTWTITANGQTSAVSFWTNPPYWIDFFTNAASGNQPPTIKFAPDGPLHTGPPLGMALSLTAAVHQPLPLRLWASDAPVLNKSEFLEPTAVRSGRASGAPPPVAIVGGQVIGGARGSAGAAKAAPDITVTWKVHRAPGKVTFSSGPIPLQTGRDSSRFVEAVNTATFDVAGEYVLRAQINDESGEGGTGDQCCWTNAHVKVTVK